MQEVRCRMAPSLGALESTPEEIWGTKPYNEETDKDLPCVFFGLYGLNDFYSLWRHRGKRYILWAGSDIRHFFNGYWLDDKGDYRIESEELAPWLNDYCENWVENEVEYELLKKLGVEANVCPSFLGNVSDYQISYSHSERPKLYTSVSGNNFKLYGWDKIETLAEKNPSVEFHLYGSTEPFDVKQSNIFIHGRVPKEQMNKEIKEMQGALRLTQFDGFSEILAKSILWGQWPVSLIEYPHILRVNQIGQIKFLEKPNTEGRDYYLTKLNKFPWNTKNW